MAEFADLRDQLAAHRSEREQARVDALLAAEAVRGVERSLATARRTAGDDGTELQLLDERHRQAVDRAKEASARLADIDRRGAAIVEGISAFTDPVEGVARLSDRHPILLLPLRLETRFKSSPTGQPQLWVRVYPDECLVDGFEESLTETEVRAGTAFWAAVWRACGDEGRERAAWRELVATCGSGRAGWIVRQLVPANPGEQPSAEEGTVRLILVAPDPQPAAVLDYWSAVWAAHGDGTALALARSQLDAALGSAAAADVVVANPPVNVAEPAPAGVAAPVAKVSVLRLPDPAQLPLRTTSWSSAPRVEVLPDRFVLLAYDDPAGAPVRIELSNPVTTPLIAGPDPNAPPSEQLKPTGADPDHPDTLQIPDDLRWLFDFERALKVGMAFRFDLTADQARLGFERLLVVGVRLTDTADSGAQTLARLMEHHLYSRKGLELLRQGTPTNDSESGGSGHSWREDPDASFEPFFKQVAQYTRVADPLDVRDGQRLADGLGLPDTFASRIPGAGLTDRAEAHAMQIALWPATIGYFMDTLMEPVFTDATVAATRHFFTQQVSGRGPLPALRIGMQPYGIQPIVAFPRLSWFGGRQSAQTSFLANIVALIRQVEADYRALLPRVSRIGADHDDSHQALLDVLGLHPTSVEYYPLGADSLEHKTYELSFFAGTLVGQLMDMFPNEEPVDLLRRLGYTGAEIPELLTKIYRSRQKPLDGPLVDDVPLSETAPIRAYASGRNYIEWLVAAAQDSVAAVQAELGFDDNKRPAALLYLLLRHAVQLDFHETAIQLLLQADVVPSSVMLRKEPAFVHVADASVEPSESRYAVLFQADQRVTDNVDLSIGDYIARHARQLEQSLLPEHLAALDRLAKLPTARLERLFAEHIDTVSYRLDAWKTGIIDFGLQRMRAPQRNNAAVNHGPVDGGVASGGGGGIYLGTYGWVEQLRPEGKDLHAVELPADLADVVNAHDTVALMKDPTNLGLIHTPSINHASTAAVLRNAYVAHSGEISVNLSSRRVRAALAILEGMRGGQSLGALLGYQFERFVHDNGPLTVRALVYPMRREYPLAANQIQATATIDGEAKESIAAMNVVDGRKLVTHVEQFGNDVYPFGNANLPRRSAGEEQAITDAVRYIRDINDAVADLVVSEGVHQAVLGNYDRSAGTLDAFAKGNTPPEPEVIRTPRSGTTLTLRTAIHLPLVGGNPVSPILMTPLAEAEPSLNRWLADRLPDPANVAVLVDYVDHATGMPTTVPITQVDLGLQPADLLYRTEARTDQALGDLDDRILARLHAVAAVTIDQPITIRHTTRIPGSVTFFELEGLLRSLRRLVVGARPLRPADLVRQGDARSSDQSTSTVPLSRLSDARTVLHDTHLPALGTVAAQVVDPLRTIDEVIGLYEDAVSPLAAYRIPGAGTGFAFEWRAGAYVALTKLLATRVADWDGRLTSYTAVMADYSALPITATTEAQLQLLRTAEALVSTTVSSGLAPPAQLLAVTAKHDALVAKRDALEVIATVSRATLADLVADAVAASDTSAFDHDAFDLSAPLADIERFRDGLVGAITRLTEQVQKRIDAADAAITKHATAAAGEQADIVIAGLRAVFGEDFVSVPTFTLPPTAASELANAIAHSTSGGLTKHLTDPPPTGSGRDFPEDDWFHGVARVRGRMHHLENVMLLSGALAGATAPTLTPVQLPHEAAQPWLALEIPTDYEVTSERLLYTSSLDVGFDPTGPVCGLLIDEWTEVIPSRLQTTGVAFHHDRPNAEPPQAWLLAVPAVFDEAWSWDDLIGAVNDALDSAKLRAVEPVHLDATPYDALVPATHSAWTYPEISISNNLLRNVKIYDKLVLEQ